MNIVIRNILAVIAGIILGSIVNMAIIYVSGFVIPPPDGVDVTNMEGLLESMHLFEPKHFLMPFLAHALGAFVGAFLTARIAATRKLLLGMVIGAVFLIGGIINVVLLPSPLWFNITDLALAYIPMSYIGAKLGGA